MRNTNRRERRSHESFDLSRDNKNLIEDYVFCIGSCKQVADFETTNKFVINCIKKICTCKNSISKSLRLLTMTKTKKWNPRLWVSAATGADTKAREIEEFELILKAKLDKVIKRKIEYNNNMFKAHSEL